jgi:hypothetical protein
MGRRLSRSSTACRVSAGSLAAVRHSSSWLLDQNLTTRRSVRQTSRHARAQSGGVHLNRCGEIVLGPQRA